MKVGSRCSSNRRILMRSCLTVKTLHDSINGDEELKKQALHRRISRKNTRKRNFSLEQISTETSKVMNKLQMISEHPKESFIANITVQLDAERVIDDRTFNREFNVSFGSIETREYPIMLGDNPGGTFGPPLTIDWTPEMVGVTMGVEEYENTRPPRRIKSDMIIPSQVRFSMLKKAGHSDEEINKMCLIVSKIKSQRRHSIGMEVFEDTMEGIEAVKRFLKKFTKRKNYREEKRRIQFWRDADRNRRENIYNNINENLLLSQK